MPYYLGLDVGGTNLSAGVVDESNRVIGRGKLPAGAGRPLDAVIRDMVRAMEQAAEAAGMALRDFPRIGVGLPSNIDPQTGHLVYANNFGWRDLDIRREFARYISNETLIENDANCAAIGEMLAGAAKGYPNAVIITLGTGVGCGIFLKGRLFRGADRTGVEFGHTKLVYGGRQCTCGQRGCVEEYCSANGLAKEGRKWMPDQTIHGAKDVFDQLIAGNPKAENAWDQYLEYLSCAIGNLITVFRPDAVVIGGGVSNTGDRLIRPLTEKVKKNTFSASEIGIPPILTAQCGDDAGIIGAARLESITET